MPNRLFNAFWAMCFLLPSLLTAQATAQVVITGPSVVCYGSCAQYTATFTSPGGNPPLSSNIVWFNNNGVSLGTGTSIFICFPPFTSGTLFVSATSPNGQQALTDTINITVLPTIPLAITSDNGAVCSQDSSSGPSNPDNVVCQKVCPYSTVTYSINPLLSGQQGVQWTVTGADSYTVNQPSGLSVTVNWGGPGTGSISVKADPGSTSSYCTTEGYTCVTIVEEPQAAFATDPAPASPPAPVQVCKGQTVYFDNQSANADAFEWYFGDGSQPSAAVETEHTYLNPGLYEVMLIARTACLCSDTTFQTIEVLDADAPMLDCTGTICAGETATYTTSASCPDYNWSVSSNGTVLGGGSPTDNSITVQWNNGPNGSVSLFTPACAGFTCPFPSTTRIPVLDDNAEIVGPEQVCPGDQSVYYIEPYGGTNFVWSLPTGGVITSGHGTNKITVQWQNFPNPNFVHWVSVAYDNCYLGCGGQDSIPVRVLSPFIITGPVERCEGASGTFTAKLVSPTQNLNCNWTLEAPDGSIVWTGNNTATANVIFNNGPGRYRLIAEPTSPNQSCTDRNEWVINVPAAPVALTGIDGPTLICPGNPVTYTATGISPLSNVLWTIQNGPGAPTTANGENLSLIWNNTGPYWLSAQQVSTDGLGCTSDTVRLDVAAVGGVSVGGLTSVCLNTTATYSLPELDNADYQWQISPAGAGTIASGQGTASVEIFWQSAGVHSISIAVCNQTALFGVTVNAPPAPQVTAPANLCAGATAVIQTVDSYTSYTWQNAGGSVLGSDPTITLGPGNYAVEVSDANGCTGSGNFNIATAPAPNFTISTNDPTAFCNNSVFVTMQALTTADGDYDYEWFLNGTPLGVNASSYTTNQYGVYTATATNQFGCSASAGPISIVVDCGGGGGGGGLPGGGFPPCPPGAITLTVSPTPACDSFLLAAGGSGYLSGSAQWTFGQSGASIFGTASGDNTSFVFPNAGEYVVVLIAAQTSGGLCRLVDSMDVEAVAEFEPFPECPGQATTFQDVSTFLPGSNITAWQWNFGDPGSGANNSSTIRNASHVFASGGSYDVTLTVTALSGCTSSETEQLLIESGPSVSFAQPAAACSGNASEFTATLGAGVTDVSWNFGDPGSGLANTAGGSTVFHDYAAPGLYTVSVTATNTYGCTTVFSLPINISANGLSGTITPAVPAPFCEGGSTTLTAPPGAVSYLWSDSTTAATLMVFQEGAYSVTLTDANGCTYAPPVVVVEETPGPDAIIKALLTNDYGQVIGVSYPSLGACAGEDVTLQAFGAGNLTYTWSNGETTVQNIFSEIRNNLLSEGTHIFTLTVTDVTTGCTAVAQSFVVDIHPVPSGFFVSANGFCAGATTLTYNGPQPPNWQISWNTGATGPNLVVEEGGSYFVQVVNEFGCIGQSSPIQVLPGPPEEAIPSGCHTRCNPDTLCLPPLTDVVGWQWYFNGAPIPGATSPDFVATQSGTYWAQLTDLYGCTAQSGDLVLDLYDGFGDILGQVWADANSNGIVDAADTLVSGIAVNLWQNGATVGNTQSNSGGNFVFAGVDAANYDVALDTALLPPGWQIVIGQQNAPLSGCDVETNTDLLISQFCVTAIFDTLQLGACAGESVTYNSTAIPAGSSQSFQFLSAAGCDSTVTVNVAVLTSSTGTVNAQACPGESFDYNGTLIPAGQSQQVTLTNYLGCDSIVTVTVGILPTSTGSVNAQACPGESFDYNGTLIPAGQSQQFTLTNYLGCDSIVTVTVGTLPTSIGTVNAQACPGESFDYNGTLIPAG
ncbi:MAG: PKD domain-containing protein, partial [Saprospiraceae bacterium]|nr:PKD domain-containing protein [Saprospiraceae bacterium]